MKDVRWLLISEILYTLVVLATCLRIIYDTRSTTKTLAYLMLTVFLPVAGIIIYFCVGTNYRKRKLYSKKIIKDEQVQLKITDRIYKESKKIWATVPPEIEKYQKLAKLLLNDGLSYLSGNNQVKLLLNGEHKFEEVMRSLKLARNHIHIEYYIFEDDHIGNAIKDIL
ncbi:MAG: PLDc N-terminal domain-containing protein, partial [Pedobacter sp.]|nr:PLDc N-terminal domain-containing protein [Pedobacter sp.]